MKAWFVPARAQESVRALEATADQVISTGAMLGMFPGTDPIDGDTGYRLAGTAGVRSNREVPWWTQEKARTYSIAAYRYNPMARAVIDTYTSFCVGDSGVKFECSDPEVYAVVEEYWNDPRNRVGDIQDLWLRTLLLTGEELNELMVGELSGVVRFNPIDPAWISAVVCRGGNPMWPQEIQLRSDLSGTDEPWPVVAVNDQTGLREGRAMFAAPWKTLMTDKRGQPFLSPILDDIDAYDTVISNLIDRTALGRYLVWDVEVQGDEKDVAKFIAGRQGTHIPPSGAMEVHTDKVKWEPKTAATAAMEDSIAASTVLTKLSAGAGLAKTWLAEPDGANRATSLTMAEPVRRRVGSVQNVWLALQTEYTRFVVDRAVAAKRLAPTVTIRDAKTKQEREVPASQSVTVTGPKIAAADAHVTAQMLLNLSTGLEQLVAAGILAKEAAAVAAKKAWEQFVGVPYSPSLDSPEANPDDLATHIDDTTGGNPPPNPSGDPRKLRVVNR